MTIELNSSVMDRGVLLFPDALDWVGVGLSILDGKLVFGGGGCANDMARMNVGPTRKRRHR